MILNVKDLGKIKNASIDLSKKLVLFTGYNNTGKTYLNYLLYGLYKLPYGRIEKRFFSLVKITDSSEISVNLSVDLKDLYVNQLDKITSIYSELLLEYCSTIFADNTIKPKIEIAFTEEDKQFLIDFKTISINHENFSFKSQYSNIENNICTTQLKEGILSFKFPNIKNTNENIPEIKKEIYDLVRLNTYHLFELRLKKIASFNHISQRSYSPKAFFFPAERATLNQYASDIILTKAEKYEQNDNPYPFETKQNNHIEAPEYPIAINDYIKLVFNAKKRERQTSDFEKYAVLLESMIGGRILLDQYGTIKFETSNQKQLSLHIVSSTVKCLASIILYLRHQAQVDDIVFIDEPELNLHPVNQRHLAKTLALLINSGIKIIISTHSDYISKELSSLVLLNKNESVKKELKKEFGLSGEEAIDEKDIKIYAFNDTGIVDEICVNDYGIEIESFEDTIYKQSQMFEKIYHLTSENE